MPAGQAPRAGSRPSTSQTTGGPLDRTTAQLEMVVNGSVYRFGALQPEASQVLPPGIDPKLVYP
jgi:hypothetical protein